MEKSSADKRQERQNFTRITAQSPVKKCPATHNGSVKAFYAENAPPVCDISIVTHNGSVNLTVPQNLSAKVDASTHNGSINTDLPITITGMVKKKKLSGTIGRGEGNLYLKTHNGSINLKQQN
jgi:DUF4097 and DUF4098 domain-containing protein YvlB